MSDTADIDAILAGALRRLAGDLGGVLQVWPAVVGGSVAEHATPVALRDGTLKVSCDSAVWASEVAHLGGSIVDGLRQRLPGAGVARIRCVVRA